MTREVILTGIRSNDEPTLGNFLGAFLPMVSIAKERASDYQINMFVPDLHSFTTPTDHAALFERTMHNLKLFVAAGLPVDDENVFVYRQSYIPAHSELAWILSCFTGFGEASRMVEFKDKSKNLGDTQVSVGLFNYPILMAADILLYNAAWVPVGEDQRQHLELARTLAQRMNSRFGDLFVVPESIERQQQFVGRDFAPRIRSLRNPDKKMSKSVHDPAGTILLNDDPDEAARKIMGATTDSVGAIQLDWQNQPGVSNLLQISALLSEQSLVDVAAKWHGKSAYGDLKSSVADQVKNFLKELQERLAVVDERALQAKLESDEETMRQTAGTTLHKVQQAVGLRPRA